MSAALPDFPFATPRQRAEWLRQLPIFRDSELDTLELFAIAMADVEMSPGTVLCRQGDASNEVFVIVRGDTEIQVDHEGRRVANDRVEAGSCVGEMAVLTGQPRSATVIAGSHGAAVVVIPGTQFRNLLLTQPNVGVGMLALLGQRLRQSEVRKRNAELAERVDVMVRNVAETEATLRARTDFLAAISHEIRTPLNGMIGLTELVLDTALTPTQREYLTMVRESGETLQTLINDLLDMAKIEAGQMQLEQVPFALRDRLGDALKPLAVRAHRKGLELDARVRPAVPDALVGDSLRLRQVVVNLVGNAIKFTEQGEVQVDVSLTSESDHVVELQFAVRDTGVGIPKERLATIFQPYSQADSSIARRFGGTGLGLSISVQLVQRMGGRLWVESTLGQGSTFFFTVRLPRGTTSGPANDVEFRRWLDGRSALVVEPHTTTRESLTEALESLGLRVAASAGDQVAATSVAAQATESAPLLVVIDGQLPDGLSRAEGFRRRDVPLVVMLLTTEQSALGARCDELGIMHVLKPVKLSELRELLAAHAESARAPAATASSGRATSSPAAPAAATPSTAAPSPASSPAATVTYRILLAEDNPINQKVARSVLEKMGHSVVVATTGREALGAVAAQKFDVVLMDVLMPEMDGLEATAAIRQIEAGSGGHLPIVAMTAHSQDEEGPRCLAAGMDAFVSKPVKPERLAEVLHTVVGSKSGTSESTGASGPGGDEPRSIDWAVALANVGGNRELLGEIVALVQAEIPRLLAETLAAVADRKARQLQMAACTLKGLLRTLGPQRAMTLAEQLESAGETQELTKAPDLFVQLEQATRRLLSLLGQFQQAKDSS